MNKLIIAVSMLGALCASPASAELSTISTKTGTIAPPPQGSGQVVFFRTSVVGALLGCTARENDAELARLGVGKYYVVPLTPGVHTFSAKSIESKDKLRIEVEPGETYFVKCSIAMGFMSGHPKLSPSDEKTFADSASGLAAWAGPKPASGSAAAPAAASTN